MDWKSFGGGWRRASSIVLGYACRVGCKHEPKGDHGISADKWFYVVSDGECAVALTVRSGTYPATVDVSRFEAWMREPDATDLSLHVPWPAAGDFESLEEKIRQGDVSGQACDIVEGGRCWIPRSTSLGSKEFFQAHGVAAFEQPESFWEALRAKAAAWIAEERKDRAQAAHLRQCPTCAGRGVVEER